MWDDIKNNLYRYNGQNTTEIFCNYEKCKLTKTNLYLRGHWSEVENSQCRTNKKKFNLKFYKSSSGFIQATKSLKCKNAIFLTGKEKVNVKQNIISVQ